MTLIADLGKNFRKLAERGGLLHGYILFGHESTEEKRRFAKELIGYLEHKRWAISLKPLIDALTIDTESGENGIDIIRTAKRFLWQTPAVSSKRTLIIDRADALTIPAQNAILKIAEEPPPHALIILIVKSPEVLLPALHSRFQKIYVHGSSKLKAQSSKLKIPSKDKLKEIIEDDKKLEEFVAGLILELRRDKIKNWKALKELLRRWSIIKQLNVNKRLQLETIWTKLSD